MTSMYHTVSVGEKIMWEIISVNHTNFLVKVELTWVQGLGFPQVFFEDFGPTH